MKSAYRKRIVWPIIVLILLLILGSLMYVQYQWARQASDAAKAHVAADLRKSMLAWHLDLFRTFASAAVALRLNSEPEEYPNHRSYANRYLEWRAMSTHTAIVSNIYVWSLSDDRNPRMLRWDEATSDFEPAPWPVKFESLRNRLQRKSSDLALAVAGASLPEEFFADHPQKDKPFQVGGGFDNALGGWVFDPEVPVLFHPIAHEATGVNLRKPPGPLRADWLVIEYNNDALRDEILPELAQRYFSGGHGQLEYELALVAGKDQSSPIYSSGQSTTTIAQPDARLDLFGPARLPDLGSAISFSQGEENEMGDDYATNLRSYHLRRTFWFPVVRPGSNRGDWYLLVRHHDGSLSEMFTRMRRRDLAIGLGTVVLLVMSMGLVLLAGHRARVMARLQVEFVAGVSHDLRTPLSIISLAADNLADGVVSGPEAVAGYGARLQVQVRRLAERVEQILLFSSLNRHRAAYSIGTVDVKDAIDQALQASSALLEDAGIVAHTKVEPSLPPALTDPGVLSQALENLITNAVKYGADGRWLGIQAKIAQTGRGNEIQVLVEDHGIGIEHGELDKIFEPFYRSATVISRQIRGAGLGLTLTNRTIEAVGGSVSVSSTPGKGSIFVLHLPAAQVRAPEVPVETYAS